MGFLSNLRAAGTTSTAALFIEKRLSLVLAAELPGFSGDTRKLSKTLVLDLWSSIPALAQQRANPKAVLVAAAALANGIRNFDAKGRRDLSDKLFPCLRILLENDVKKAVDIAWLSPIDGELFDLAHSVFEAPKPIFEKGLFDEPAREDAPEPHHSPAPTKEQFAGSSARVSATLPDNLIV